MEPRANDLPVSVQCAVACMCQSKYVQYISSLVLMYSYLLIIYKSSLYTFRSFHCLISHNSLTHTTLCQRKWLRHNFSRIKRIFVFVVAAGRGRRNCAQLMALEVEVVRIEVRAARWRRHTLRAAGTHTVSDVVWSAIDWSRTAPRGLRCTGSWHGYA